MSLSAQLAPILIMDLLIGFLDSHLNQEFLLIPFYHPLYYWQIVMEDMADSIYSLILSRIWFHSNLICIETVSSLLDGYLC